MRKHAILFILGVLAAACSSSNLNTSGAGGGNSQGTANGGVTSTSSATGGAALLSGGGPFATSANGGGAGLSAVTTVAGIGGVANAGGSTAALSQGGTSMPSSEPATGGAPSPASTNTQPQASCTNYCLQQSKVCADSTVITGTVYAPNGTLPISNALVYVPNGSMSAPYGLTPFVDGVASGFACGGEIGGSPLVTAISGIDGSFALANVPLGADIPLVIQLGRWRRLVTIPAVTECQNTKLPAELTRFPSRQNMGNNGNIDAIPLMALVTGSVDAFECVLRKIGIEDSQFSNAGGSGRVRFYRDNGATCTDGGGACSGTTPDYLGTSGLVNQDAVDQYDALIFPCNGSAHDVSAAVRSLVLDSSGNPNAFVNKGGRAFFTHFSYAWLYAQAPANQLPWRGKSSTGAPTTSLAVDSPSSVTHHDPALSAQVDTSFIRGKLFATWLGLPQVGALSVVTPPQIPVIESRWNLENPADWNNPSSMQRWAFYTNNLPNPGILNLSFDTPFGLAADRQCGRVVFSDFHVTTAALSGTTCTNPSLTTSNCSFPAECGSTFSAQEKILAYMLFDMSNNVSAPPLQTCTPRRCSDFALGTCGPQGDGCGGIVDCGDCACAPVSCEQACPQGTCTSTYSTTTGEICDCPQPTGCSNPSTIHCWCRCQ